MAKRKGDDVNRESNKCRITYERSLDDDNIAEILVYEYLENELMSSDNDSSDTESDSDDETDVN
jgi:hypothetical protein